MPSPGNVQNSCEFSGLNQGPLDLQSNALPTEQRRQMSRNGEKETIKNAVSRDCSNSCELSCLNQGSYVYFLTHFCMIRLTTNNIR